MSNSSPAKVRLSDEDRQEISDLASAVIEEHHNDDRAVDPLAIAKAKEILVVYGDYEDAFDGLLRYRESKFTIYANLNRLEGERTRRARFTIAHELGHFFISSHRRALVSGHAPFHPSFCEFESKVFVEQQADYFASNLLLPHDRFMVAAKKQGVSGGLRTILGLSDKFDTSVTATAIRFVSLNLSPCIVIKWNADKYGWKWLSEHAYRDGYRKTIEDRTQVIEGSATAKAFAGETPPSCGYYERASVASAWFPFVNSGSQKDVILQEQAVPLGRYGVLTFLFPIDGSFGGQPASR